MLYSSYKKESISHRRNVFRPNSYCIRDFLNEDDIEVLNYYFDAADCDPSVRDIQTKKSSTKFADYLSAIRDHIIKDSSVWKQFTDVLFPEMQRKNPIFYSNVMKII